MTKYTLCQRALIATTLLLLSFTAQPHPAIEHQLEAVNAQLKKQPDDAELLISLGKLYLEYGDNAKALEHFSHATALEPTLGDAWYWKAQSDKNLQHFNDALKDNQHFMQLYIRHPADNINQAALSRGYFQCGDILMGMNKPADAATCYQNGISNNDHASPEQYLLLINSLRASSQSDAAIKAVENAIHTHGELPQLLLAIAEEIETERQHFQAALRWLDRALQKPYRHEYLLLQKAQLQRSMHDEKGAQQSLQAALDAITALPLTKQHSQATLEQEKKIRSAISPVRQQ